MYCPKCKNKTLVIDSVAQNERVYRQRICGKCGYEFCTMEAITNTTATRSIILKLRYKQRRSNKHE